MFHLLIHSFYIPFMYCMLVLSKTTLCNGLAITFPAWVRHAFMYCLLVLTKTSLCGGLICIFPSWVLLPLMFWLLVFCPITCINKLCMHCFNWGWVRWHSEVAWYSYSFMNCLFVLIKTTLYIIQSVSQRREKASINHKLFQVSCLVAIGRLKYNGNYLYLVISKSKNL